MKAGQPTYFRKIFHRSFLLCLLAAAPALMRAQGAAPLKLVATIPLPGLKEGDFDHFLADPAGHRMFLTSEENGLVEVMDTDTNTVIHTITGMDAPHSMTYRADLKKLFVVDGDASEIKVYDSTSYALVGHIKLWIDSDSRAYDARTKLMYVVGGGREAKTPYSWISVVDTTASKKIHDIKVDTNWLEALVLDDASPRLFANLTSLDAVGVFNRKTYAMTAKWPIPADTHGLSPLYLDAANHRLLMATRKNPKLIVMDSNSGAVKGSFPCVEMVDDMAVDPKTKRVYLPGDKAIEVFRQDSADHYTSIGKIATSARAKTATFVPELNRLFLAVPHEGSQQAEVRIYEPVM